MMTKLLNYSEKINIILILLVSFAANYYYGSIGVFPVDTFAFFDSDNFINKGFLQIRDYWTSNGFLVDFFQSIFFRIFGTNWYSYLLHSSFLNFIFAFLTYRFFLNEGLTKNASLFYSLSVAILAYPPVGVPFPDHHSLIFSLISIYFLIFTIKKKSEFYLLATIISLSIAFLSKQVPAGFFSFNWLVSNLFFVQRRGNKFFNTYFQLFFYCNFSFYNIFIYYKYWNKRFFYSVHSFSIINWFREIRFIKYKINTS